MDDLFAIDNTQRRTKMENKEENSVVSKEWMSNFMEKLTANLELSIEAKITKCENTIMSTLYEKIGVLESEIHDLKKENSDLLRRMEGMEQRQRKNNIKISGLRVKKEELQHTINSSLTNIGQQMIKLQDIIMIPPKANEGPLFIATCESFEEKARLLKIKKNIMHQGAHFYINDDLTKKESEIQFHLRNFARSLPRGTAAVAYGRVYAQNSCYVFNEALNQVIEDKNFIKRP